jgi:hypothetical protein
MEWCEQFLMIQEIHYIQQNHIKRNVSPLYIKSSIKTDFKSIYQL